MVPLGDLDLILIGLGSNLPGSKGSPRQTLVAALECLAAESVCVTRRSRFWRTRPVPISDQPWFVNAVAAVETNLSAEALLDLLHRIEDRFGRVRSQINAARVLDLDLLAFGRQILDVAPRPLLPHPRMSERAFVLLPLKDIAPGWVHPASGESLDLMISKLEGDQGCVAEEESFEGEEM
jgi:2-amino-4-hydroxy-6-hydroxymethyldihydropteridine diphosphokinase